LKDSKSSFISSIGISSIHCVVDLAKGEDISGTPIVYPRGIVGFFLLRDMGAILMPLLFIPGPVLSIGDFGLCMALDAAVPVK